MKYPLKYREGNPIPAPEAKIQDVFRLLAISDSGAVVGVADHNLLKSEVQAIARSAEPPIAVDVESAGEVLCAIVP